MSYRIGPSLDRAVSEKRKNRLSTRVLFTDFYFFLLVGRLEIALDVTISENFVAALAELLFTQTCRSRCRCRCGESGLSRN